MTLMKRSLLLTTAAAALGAGLATAHATPADEVTALLDSPELSGWAYYETIVDAPDGGVDIHHLQLTANALIEIGLLTYPDDAGNPYLEPIEDSPVVATIDNLHFNPGVLGIAFGMRGDGAPNTAGLALEGFTFDLAAMSGANHIDLLRQYIGGAETVSGSASLSVSMARDGWYSFAVNADLDNVGRFTLDTQSSQFGENLPSGTLTFTDTENHGMTGLAAFAYRVQVESTLTLLEFMVEQSHAYATDDDAVNQTLAELQIEIDAVRAELERVPADGTAAAAAVGAWADAMAAALPDRADLFDAIHQFAEAGGTLTVTLDPPDGAAMPEELGVGAALYNDAAKIDGIIDSLGLTVSLTEAE